MLVSRLHMPTLRAVAYARATRPNVLEALTVNVDDADTRTLVAEWESRDIPVPLKVVESPYRETSTIAWLRLGSVEVMTSGAAISSLTRS